MSRRCAWVAALFFSCLAWPDPFPLGSDRFLFLDTFLLDETSNAHLAVNPPSNIELVMVADRPWEKGGITSYGNVLHDPERDEYRLYYVPVSWDESPGFCYALATSKDGVHWEKPPLGAVEWRGSKDNNIVLWAQREGTVIIDPNARPDRRYALISSHPDLKTRLFTSPDGIHFTMDEQPISSLHSDSQISTFWDKDLNRYLHFPRVVEDGRRAVGMVQTTTMNEPWPETIPVVMSGDERDPPELDLYTNACQKYALSRNAYLGFPTPYYHYNPEPRKYLNEPTLAKGGKTNDGTIETQLAVSRNGSEWTRYRFPYIALGNYDGLDVKVAMMIPGLLHRERKIYQYFMGYTFTHGDTQVRYGDGGRDLGGVFRAEQRIDGFTSLDFDYEGGTVTTGPLTFTGQRLLLNLNTSASGEARVAILDEAGNEIPGFAMADSRLINGDYLAANATWKDGQWDVSSLQGQVVRLRFACRGAKLYSFRFAAPGIDAPYAVERAADEPVPSFNSQTVPASQAVDASQGPHLLIDDFLIAESENVIRATHSPVRAQDQPILGWEQETTQPYVTVIRDGETGRFRMWYNSRIGRECAIAYAESEDGIQWTTPPVGPSGEDNRLFVISAPFQNAYGVSVIDEGLAFADATRRFKMAWWGQTKPWPDGDPGMRVAFSPDGLHWTPEAANPVLPDYGEEWFKDDPRRPYGASDIIDVFRDPIRQRYAAFVKTPALPIDGLETGSRARTFIRRLVSQSASADFVRWERPWRVVVPESNDEGLLEFYSVGGTFARGALLIGFVRMLHDDYPCEPGGPADGIGYTSLVTSRDGEHWERHPDIFFDRNPQPGAWDRAMTWVGSLVDVGDQYYLYYGGYARGHKIEPEKERQLGLAVMPKDRFVSRDAQAGTTGRLLTVPLAHVHTAGVQLCLNANARGGSIRVRVLEEDGKPIPGLGFDDCTPVTEDGLALSVPGLAFESLSNDHPVRLEFELAGAQLFGFEFK